MSEPGAVFDSEWISRITLQRSFRKDLDPLCFFGAQAAFFTSVGAAFAEVASFQRKSLGIVAGEKTGVHDDAANHARKAQADNAPIMPGSAATACFPAVHPFSTSGVLSFDKNRIGLLEQILFGRKKIVVGVEHTATQANGSEIGELREIPHRFPRRSTCPTGALQKLPRSEIFTPCRKVASTIPIRSRPA